MTENFVPVLARGLQRPGSGAMCIMQLRNWMHHGKKSQNTAFSAVVRDQVGSYYPSINDALIAANDALCTSTRVVPCQGHKVERLCSACTMKLLDWADALDDTWGFNEILNIDDLWSFKTQVRYVNVALMLHRVNPHGYGRKAHKAMDDLCALVKNLKAKYNVAPSANLMPMAEAASKVNAPMEKEEPTKIESAPFSVQLFVGHKDDLLKSLDVLDLSFAKVTKDAKQASFPKEVVFV